MSRKKFENMHPRERNRILDEFWTMVALLESKDEVRGFFKDLLSASESVMLARRIQIAKLLLSGWSYEAIESQIGAGPTTIASVHRWLHGGFGGYARAIPKLTKELQRQDKVAERRVEESVPLSAAWMRKRYPLHYFLVNMLRGGEDLTPPRKLGR
ncbi:MAG: TrpR-like protein YerC/YecD [Parcubacteria group bacterium Greene0416_79]|nr:MAG: TrpR-like protein YerC/YecD [Parcubacteria group bacterium Greene0416_79]